MSSQPFSGLPTFRWVLARVKGSKGRRRAPRASQRLSELLAEQKRMLIKQELISRAEAKVLANFPAVSTLKQQDGGSGD